MIRTSIVCDKCGAVGWVEEGPVRRPAWKMRSDIHSVGWLTGMVDGKDYCPECRVWALNKAKEKK